MGTFIIRKDNITNLFLLQLYSQGGDSFSLGKLLMESCNKAFTGKSFVQPLITQFEDFGEDSLYYTIKKCEKTEKFYFLFVPGEEAIMKSIDFETQEEAELYLASVIDMIKTRNYRTKVYDGTYQH